jgi:2,3-bisphosphoglycerate-independent phosphoglycerate mutase
MKLNYKPVVLIVLDGFGAAPPSPSNAVSSSKKPFFDSLIKDYPTMLLQASSINVGLPYGEVGNSEVGHLSIGSGILRYQSLPRINRSIETGELFKLPGLQEALKRAKNRKCKLHLIGLIGNGCIHASQVHLEALINFVGESGIGDNLFLHLFLDGRDTAKDVGKGFMSEILEYCKQKKAGQVASVGGRFYGMDRNKNWDRIQKAYDVIVYGKADKIYNDPVTAIEESYAKKVYDEEMEPVVIVDKGEKPIATIEDGDVVIYFNYRADRGRQLTEALVEDTFKKFEHKKFKDLYVVTFAEYKKGLPVEVLFPPEIVENPIAKIFSEYKLKQLHIAETEKYAHVTFFLNGMKEKSLPGEERILVSSPAVTSYDQKPEMSAYEVTDNIMKALKSDKFDFMAINYANPDMVGHTGDLKATVQAIQAVDTCLAKVVPEVVKRGGVVFIVGDHGNAEEMINPTTGDIDKEHNMYPVPFITVSQKFSGQPSSDIIDNDISLMTPMGLLSDVAPTILGLAGLPTVPEMTGTCLFNIGK